MIQIVLEDIKVVILDEPTYTANSSDNIRSYNSEYCRNDEYELICAHGVLVKHDEEIISSVVLLGVGGATRVHDKSIASDGDILYVAAGDALFALGLPSLELKWFQKADFSTCFGIFWLEKEKCLITWGEVEICRFTDEGVKEWGFSAADIFSEGFEILEDIIKLTDFSGAMYKINIKTGDIV